ncbi:MAG: fused MFS/spermidine synthase [Halopseudomonas sp.]
MLLSNAISSHQQGKLIHNETDQQGLIQIRQWQQLRWLHLDDNNIQACINLDSPATLTIAYLEAMVTALLFKANPQNLLNLGCGGASFERFFSRYLPTLAISSVDINATIIRLARQFFQLPPQHPVIHRPAEELLHHCNQTFDLIFCDLHHGVDHPGSINSKLFHADAYRCLNYDGVYVLNLLPQHEPQMLDWLLALRQSFNHVILLPITGRQNIVVLALKQPPASQDQLIRQAIPWQRLTGINFEALAKRLILLPNKPKS